MSEIRGQIPAEAFPQEWSQMEGLVPLHIVSADGSKTVIGRAKVTMQTNDVVELTARFDETGVGKFISDLIMGEKLAGFSVDYYAAIPRPTPTSNNNKEKN